MLTPTPVSGSTTRNTGMLAMMIGEDQVTPLSLDRRTDATAPWCVPPSGNLFSEKKYTSVPSGRTTRLLPVVELSVVPGS